MLEYQNIKVFLQTAMFLISLKKFLWLRKLKILCGWDISLVILRGKKSLELFAKTNCKKQIKKIRIEKVIKRKGGKLYVKWKAYNNLFNSWINKKDKIKNE